jgi:hypothetical protein
MRRFAIFGTTHVIHCIITNCACLSGNKLTNWCPSSCMIFNLECIICIRNYKDMIHIKLDYKIILQCIFNFFQCTDVREVNLVYCLSGNKLTNWCPSSHRVFKSIKVIFHCSWAVHLERNISFKESIHNCNCGFPWFNLSLLIICCLWQLPLCIGYTRLTSLTLKKIENALWKIIL